MKFASEVLEKGGLPLDEWMSKEPQIGGYYWFYGWQSEYFDRGLKPELYFTRVAPAPKRLHVDLVPLSFDGQVHTSFRGELVGFWKPVERPKVTIDDDTFRKIVDPGVKPCPSCGRHLVYNEGELCWDCDRFAEMYGACQRCNERAAVCDEGLCARCGGVSDLPRV